MASYRKIDTPKIKFEGEGDPGPAPILQWIEIADLVIDDRYQRPLMRENWTAIRKIAAAFQWRYFSPVFIAPVEGGKYAVIDGQHRAHAAQLRGIKQVPCQIVPMDLKEQAKAFAAVNGNTTKVSVWSIFRAALTAGEKWAVDSATACTDAGCQLMTTNKTAALKKPGEIYAVTMISRIVALSHGPMVTIALKALLDSEFGKDSEAWGFEILKPWLNAVTSRPWLKKYKEQMPGFVDDFDIWAAFDRAEAHVKVMRRNGETGVAKWDLVAADMGDGLEKHFASA